jgi:hypothetical protein
VIIDLTKFRDEQKPILGEVSAEQINVGVVSVEAADDDQAPV